MNKSYIICHCQAVELGIYEHRGDARRTMNAVPVLNLVPEVETVAEKSVLKQDEKGDLEETKIAVEEVEE